MKVKFNGVLSEFLALIGGGPQGTLLGQLEYLVQSNENADNIPPEDRFKYIDDLSLLQLVLLSGLLVQYNFREYVASDIKVGISASFKLQQSKYNQSYFKLDIRKPYETK